ncbi:hypothetical protein PV325_005482, partial [Microctonus aethiopoides]
HGQTIHTRMARRYTRRVIVASDCCVSYKDDDDDAFAEKSPFKISSFHLSMRDLKSRPDNNNWAGHTAVGLPGAPARSRIAPYQIHIHHHYHDHFDRHRPHCNNVAVADDVDCTTAATMHRW